MADKNLRVVVTADTKDLDKKLKSAQKTVANFGKDASKGTDAMKGFGKGLLQNTAGLGGLSAGAIAAGAAIAAMAVKAGRAAIEMSREWENFKDLLGATTSQSQGLLSTFSGDALRGVAVDYKSVLTAIGAATEKLNVDVTGLTAAQTKYWTNLGGRIAKLAEDSNQDAGQLAAAFATVEQRWAADGIAFDQTANIIYTAAKKAYVAPTQMAAMVADASGVFQRLGYTLGETAGIMSRFAEQSLDSGVFVSLLEKRITEFGGDAKVARKEVNGLIAEVTELNAAGKYGQIDALLATYGIDGKQAEVFRQAVSAGVFKGGALTGGAVYQMPEPTIENWGDLGTLISNNLTMGIGNAMNWFFKRMQAPKTPVPQPGQITTETYTPGAVPSMPVTTETGPWGYLPIKSPAPLFQSASMNFGTDYGGSFMNQMVNDNDQVTLKLEDNADLVSAKWRTSFSGIARSADYNFGSMRVVVGNATDAMSDTPKVIWTISTALGDMGIDLTDLQEKVKDWGINVPLVFDNVAKGISRIGWQLLQDLGLPYTKQEVETFVNDMADVLQKYGVNMGSFWKDLTDGVKTSTEDIGKQAVANLKGLVGDLVMTMSDMFATGEWDWKRVWNKIWQGLLSIAIDYALKIIANSELMMAAVAAIDTFLAGLKGDWVKVALITAGVAAAVAGTAAIIAKMKQGQAGTLPSAMPASGGGASASMVVINNPTFMGQIDDRSAQAVGEGFARSLAIRGAVPLPVA